MGQIIWITFKGIFRDRVFRGIAIAAFLFLLIPTISSLSMRQVVELSITLSLSLLSAIILLLSIFLGGSSLWKDTERRYTFSVLGLPLTRTSYLLGKFLGIAAFLLLSSLILGASSCIVIKYISVLYPPSRPVVWMNIFWSILFIALKNIILVACAFLFSTVSTSFFLPIFGTLAVFLSGSATQQVYDYVRSAAGQAQSPLMKGAVSCMYYLLPNFSSFDLSLYAIYGIGISSKAILLTTVYFAVYVCLLLVLSVIVFSRREFQ